MLLRTAAAGSVLLPAACALLAAACGDDGQGPATPDAGALSSLAVLDPPGESIGLPFHGEATLRVLYLDPAGRAIPDAPVAFSLVTSASEATGGSTIAASEVFTDALGLAEVQLVAGAEQVNFRVQASAADAPPALFYIAVSEGGFADLAVEPQHLGFRDPQGLGRVEVRLYRAEELRCAELDADAPPASVFPPRATDGFAGAVEYRNVTAGDAFTLVGWASAAEGAPPVSAGCVELGAAQVRPGRALHLPLPVRDRAPRLPAAVDIESTFDATSLLAGDLGAGPWTALDCPLGRAQLLIDCALDAQAPDGELDCEVGGTSALVADVQAARGARDAAGCRPATLPGGGATADALLAAALGPPWPAGAALSELLAARRAPLTSFSLSSRLESPGGGAPVYHRLGHLSVSSAAGSFSMDLIDSARPVVRAVAPAAIDPATGAIAVGVHAFTLDYGRFARAAFVALGLAPAGLDDRAGELGRALYESASSGPLSGCAAFSAIVCGAAGRAAACLSDECGAAGPALDGLFDVWWQVLDPSGMDVTLSGAAAIADDDADLNVEKLGAGEAGSWSAQLAREGAAAVPLTGSWSGAAPLD
ncbi:MAG TPA: hypothetical protein VKZ63_02995 [Kofleriaceae bacterium]|nr:hypothetical protein [Kofleriaceae bacterium]